jgi:hypothetical protein
MLSISRGTGDPGGRGRGRRGRAPFLVSVGVNVVVFALFLKAATTLHDRWNEAFAERPGEIPAERISFLRLPAGPTSQPGRSGGDGRPPSVAAPARAAPRFVPPTSSGVPAPATSAPAPAVAGAGTAPGPGGSGEIVGEGGPAAGLRPTYADPRLWQRPDVAVSAPKSAKQRVDSVIADRLGPVRDSIAAAQEIAAGQRKPGDWTVNGPGGTWGMDPRNIHLGKIKVPTALLGLLTTNLQKSLRSNPTELANDRRLAQARQEIMDHAQRGMAEDDFRGAVKAIRARKDRERAQRLAERRQNAEAAGVAADAAGPSAPPAAPR